MSWKVDGGAEIQSVEKSDVMEQHYSESIDPWGNRKRQLYQRILKYGAQQVFKYYLDYRSDLGLTKEQIEPIKIYDVGCGGGNVLDTLIENAPSDYKLHIGGCDISQSAIDFLNEHFNNKVFSHQFELIDCERFMSDNPSHIQSADIITFVDVMYYWGNVRDYRTTLDQLWDAMLYGTIVLVADSLIPYQRRSYFKSKSDCKVLEEYTDYTAPAGQLNDTTKNRYLKVKIYQKVKS